MGRVLRLDAWICARFACVMCSTSVPVLEGADCIGTVM
jgi:hypothetical protein